MNEQLPSVDPVLRAQLSRRAAGRPPAGLFDDVLSAVDAVGSRPALERVRPLGLVRRRPQVSAALAAAAAILVLVAGLVLVPRMSNETAAPGIVPAGDVLTTAQLAAVMAGPELGTNTAFLADVTIDAKSDVCPMDRYPTLGVIEGMRGQVCVMVGSITYQLSPSTKDSGVFAFRYLAPGYLGLLGKIAAASSGMAFKVTEDWPTAAKTFVVDGYLGASYDPKAVCIQPILMNDPLLPDGLECPYQDWLSSSEVMPSPLSPRLLDLQGNARAVEAAGMRGWDDLGLKRSDPATLRPVQGKFVVKSQVDACSGASPASSAGCGYWLVMAKLSPITVPASNVSPTPSTSTPPGLNLTGYPTKRALTTDELGALLDAGSLKTADIVVADIALDSGSTCPAVKAPGPMTVLGRVAGLSTQTCVYTDSRTFSPGHAVLRVIGDRALGYLGTLPEAAGGRLPYSASASWPDGKTFLVDGWLLSANVVGNDPAACPDASPDSDGNVGCATYSIADSDVATSLSDRVLAVAAGWPAPPNGHGIFAMTADGKNCADPTKPTADCEVWRIQGRLANLTSPTTPQTPVPEPTPTPALQPTASIDPERTYPFGRALRQDELARVLQGPGRKGKTVIADVTIDTAKECASLDGYRSIGTIGDSICVVGTGKVKPTPIAPYDDGVYAFRVLSSDTLGFIDNVSVGNDKAFALGNEEWPKTMPVPVQGALFSSTSRFDCPVIDGIAEPLDPAPITCGQNWIAPEAPTGGEIDEATARAKGYVPVYMPWMGPYDSNLLLAATKPVYLIRWVTPSGAPAQWEVIAQIDQIDWSVVPTPPPSTTATTRPTSSPTPSASVADATIGGLWGSGDRPLTVAELTDLWTANKLENRIVVTKGPVPAPTCLGIMSANYTCTSFITGGEAYWVVSYDKGSYPTVLGPLVTPETGFVWQPDQVVVRGTTGPTTPILLVVNGHLACQDATCRFVKLGSNPSGRVSGSLDVTTLPVDLAARVRASNAGVSGPFVVRPTSATSVEVLALLSTGP